MRFLAAWFSDPVGYWPNLIGLIVVVAVTVFIIRKIQAKSKATK